MPVALTSLGSNTTDRYDCVCVCARVCAAQGLGGIVSSFTWSTFTYTFGSNTANPVTTSVSYADCLSKLNDNRCGPCQSSGRGMVGLAVIGVLVMIVIIVF